MNVFDHFARLGVPTPEDLRPMVEGCDELDAVVRALKALPDESLSDPDVARACVRLMVQGSHARRILTTLPGALQRIATWRAPQDAETLTRHLRTAVDNARRDEDVLRELRRFKQIESLRIFLRELDDPDAVRQSAAEVADLAEACIQVAVEALARLRNRPDFTEVFCVLGMGKLGGRELNFSSDVDLIFVVDDHAYDTSGEIEALARDLVAWLERSTEDGYVFRVDLRLRPEGSAGALVPAASSARAYYEAWGRTWERSALIKARPVAGNRAVGNALLSALEPFLYRRYLDYKAIDELRAMKEMIHRNAQTSAIVGLDEALAPRQSEPQQAPMRDRLQARMQMFGAPTIKRSRPAPPTTPLERPRDSTGVLGWDVKIGVGGIREVEFFVQALQLVHCGTRPGLRVRNTLDALDRLLFAGLMNHDDHAALADGYGFLRALEHRIQMEQDKQGHRIPTSEEGLAHLAWRMGMSASQLRDAVLTHRRAIRDMFDRLFSESEQSPQRPTVGGETDANIDAVLGVDLDALDTAPIHERLSALGFTRPRQVAGQILILRQKAWGPFADRAVMADRVFARYLLSSCAGAPNPDQAFSHLTRFITLVGDRPGYFRMLADHPHAARLLVHVFGSSPYLAGALLREPAIVERLLGAGSVAVLRSREDLAADIRSRLEPVQDPEHRIGVIRRFHQEETLRIGLHDYGGAATIWQTQEQLSNVAEVVVATVLEEVYEPLRSRKRRDDYLLPPIGEIPFCVVAMGKLGSREMSFGSDLDLLFVYEYDRQWRLEHSFFAKLAQRLIRALSMAGADGKMYEVDTRLRPSGQQGALVVSLEQFRSYQANTSELWERQALVRARPLLGPALLVEAFEDVRTSEVFRRGLPQDGAQALSAMLARIREAQLEHGAVDIKYSQGGLAEIEFAIQALQMRWGWTTPALRTTRGVDALRAMAQAQVMPSVDFGALLRVYERLREVESRLRMTDLRGISALPSDVAQRDVLARRLGYLGADSGHALVEDLRRLLDQAHRICVAVFEGI